MNRLNAYQQQIFAYDIVPTSKLTRDHIRHFMLFVFQSANETRRFLTTKSRTENQFSFWTFLHAQPLSTTSVKVNIYVTMKTSKAKTKDKRNNS